MKILLTGATGFIGRYLTQGLADENEVYATYRTEIPLKKNGVFWIKADLLGKNLHRKLPDKTDIIIHSAQSRNYRDFPVHAEDIFDVNVSSTAKLLKYGTEVGIKQFIYLSTGSVYKQDILRLRSESDKIESNNFYSSSKYASEILVSSYSNIFTTNILRLFYPYGPFQRDRLIPNLIQRIQNKALITLSSNEGINISPTFVEDLVPILSKSIEHSWHGVLNVSSPQFVSMKTLCDLIGKELNILPKYEIKLKQTQTDLLPCLENLAKIYDLRNFTSLEEGLKKTLESL